MRIIQRLFKREEYVVISVATVMTVLTTIYLFSNAFFIPPDHRYVAMTHYFEDFYYYLDQFYQGREGHWLTINRFTSEDLRPTLMYFHNILMGKVGGFLGLKTYMSYNGSLILWKFLFLIISYLPFYYVFPRDKQYRLGAYFIFVFSNCFPTLNVTESGIGLGYPTYLYRVENTISSRFQNIPDYHLIGILFVVSFLLASRAMNVLKGKYIDLDLQIGFRRFFLKFLLPLTIILAFVALSDGTKSLVIILSYALVGLLKIPKAKSREYLGYFFGSLLILGIPYGIVMSYVLLVVLGDPSYAQSNQWDVSQYFYQLSISTRYFIIAFGLTGILFLLGLKSFLFKKKTSYERFTLAIVFFCVAGFFAPYWLRLPVPGFRFMFSASYIFIAVVALYGFIWLVKRVPYKHALPILILIYVCVNVLPFSVKLKENTRVLKEPEYHYTYFPVKLYDGLTYLRQVEDDKGVVLASAHTGVDLFIPAMTGKRTYSGHVTMTLNSAQKDEQSNNFFFKWSDGPMVRDFLKRNNIKYVVNTSYEMIGDSLRQRYPFLKVFYENEMVKIFTTEI